MEKIKNIIINKFETFSLLTVSILMSFMLLIFRIKLNKSFFYLFLVWNVILAMIPYFITVYLNHTKHNKLKLGFWFYIWLLFLPNAPYIITDFLHLQVSNSYFLWLDILVIFAFAFTGLFLFFSSLQDMSYLLSFHFKKTPINLITTGIIFLSGFGVYLGRYLRYNSWEIISEPQHLFSDILNMISHPNQNSEVWLFTFGFGLFLYVGFKIFCKLSSQHR